MKRILMDDCNTVVTVYAPLVCREIMMQDDLIDRLACGYVSKTSKEELQKQGFRMVGAEERGNRASCAFITELVACAFDRQIEGIDIVTNDDTILAAVVKAQEQGKDIRVLGSDAHSEAFISRCNRFCFFVFLLLFVPEWCLTPLFRYFAGVCTGAGDDSVFGNFIRCLSHYTRRKSFGYMYRVVRADTQAHEAAYGI